MLGRGSGGATGAGFKPGQSGNPSGSNPVTDFAKTVRHYLGEVDLDRPDRATKLQTLIERLSDRDPKVLLHYAFGKPQDNIALQNPDGTPLVPISVLPHMSTEELRQLTQALMLLRRPTHEPNNGTIIDIQSQGASEQAAIDVGGGTPAAGAVG